MASFEDDNRDAYVLLLRIEIAIRECIRQAMEEELGPAWQKRIPGSLLKKIRESQVEENRPQFDFITLGPLYYLTFGDLLSVLQQAPARAAVNRLGGDHVINQIVNILAPRNAVSHARPVSSVGLMAIRVLHDQLQMALTPEVMSRLCAEPDVGLATNAAAKLLIADLKTICGEMISWPQSLSVPSAFELATVQFWWGDDSLAGFSTSAVEAAVSLIREYNELPKGVGSAWARQQFAEDRDMRACVARALTELTRVPI
jgi:hypothetical protein